MTRPLLVIALLLLAAPASAQSVLTHLDKVALFGSEGYNAALWAQELDGDPGTREGLLVRSDNDRLEYLPVGYCRDGSPRRGTWMEPFTLAQPHLTGEWFMVGWIARAGDRDVYTVQGPFGGYVEVGFDLPPCPQVQR